MNTLVVLILIINLFACAGSSPNEASQSGPTAEKAALQNPSEASGSAKPVKSPHGYIITKDYQPGRFGGFIGDCSDDQNWPYYWQCMSENAGNGGFN